MTKISVRRAVFNELKNHSVSGISVSDLSIVTNFEVKEINEALKYFKSNAIVDVQTTNEGVKWYASN